MNGFQAMFGKEWKQNLKWGILALIGLAVALVIAVGSHLPHNLPNSGMDSAMYFALWGSVTLTFIFGPPLVGLLLGLLQIIPEQRRDLWAFLIHRPASRATLFWGKVAAGLSLYALATLVPLLAFAFWARTPGNIAGPFDWRLLLGALGGILLGIPFYFAALLTALRPARWWGSRALPIPAAVALAALCYGSARELWQSALMVLLVAAVFCLAAWGAFLTSGIYETQPRPARAGLGLLLYVGVIVTLGALAGLAVAAANVLFPRDVSRPQHDTAQYEITWAGQIVSEDPDGQGNPQNVHSLDGSPVRLMPKEKKFTTADLLPTDYLFPGVSYQQTAFPSAERYVTAISTGKPEEQWYYLQPARRFFGYDTQTREPVQTLASPARHLIDIVSYPDVSVGMTLLGFQHALYRFNPDPLMLLPVNVSLRGDNLRQISVINTTYGYWSSKNTDFIAATRDHFLVISSAGTPLLTVPRVMPDREVNFVFVAVTAEGKRWFFWYRSAGPRQPDHIYEYNAQGVLMRHSILPPLISARQSEPPAGEGLIGLIIPPAAAPLAIQAGQSYPGEQQSLRHLPLWLRLFCLASALTGLVGAALAWRIGRWCAYGRPGLWAWAGGVFWLGLPGVILLLALRGWPAREPCPNCHQRRVVTREQCEHCGAPFAPIALDGTEIFEEDSALADPEGGRTL